MSKGIGLTLSSLITPLQANVYNFSFFTWPCSAFGNVADYKCVFDYISRGNEIDLGLVPYFRGDLS